MHQLLTNSEVRIIGVPKLDEFATKKLEASAQQDPDISKYLPESKEKRSLNRQFLFNVRLHSGVISIQVIHTIKPMFFPSNIQQAMKKRQESAVWKHDDSIEVDPRILNAIKSSSFYSRSKTLIKFTLPRLKREGS